MGLDMYLECRSNPVDHPDEYDTEAAYWRKANQIHGWFSENGEPVEGEEEMWYITRDDISELIDVCKLVKEHCIIENVKDEHKNASFRDTEEAEVFASSVLPTCTGFFFGSTAYDGWYAQDILFTITKLENVLADYDEEVFRYVASW